MVELKLNKAVDSQISIDHFRNSFDNESNYLLKKCINKISGAVVVVSYDS